MERTIEMYNEHVYGVKVSEYGIESGYLDYRTLSKIVGNLILNNTVFAATPYCDWEIVSGRDDGDAVPYQYYMISEFGVAFLIENTDELVYYNEELNIYIWGISHFGTSWDYVLTDIKLVNK